MLSMKYYLVFIGLLLHGIVMAQPGGNWRDRTPESMAERTTQHMADSLNLSSAQLEKISAVNLDFAKKIASARAENMGDREAMRSTMRGLRVEQMAALGKYLTTDQLTKWKSIQEQRRTRPRERGPDRKGSRAKKTIDQS